jgi:hypothetical protein
MKDVNSAILQAYYEVVDNLDIPCFEGEEPDDIKNPVYCVISDVTSTETSTDNSSDVNATIQLSFHSWKYKYNNSADLNTTVGQVLEAIKPDSNSVLDLSSFGLQMLNLSIQTDRTDRIGELGGKIFITRILIFKQDIFIL